MSSLALKDQSVATERTVRDALLIEGFASSQKILRESRNACDAMLRTLDIQDESDLHGIRRMISHAIRDVCAMNLEECLSKDMKELPREIYLRFLLLLGRGSYRQYAI